MRRYLAMILLAFAAIFACVTAAHAAIRMRPAEVGGIRTSLPQLVDITYHQAGTYYSCSGAIISPDVILTAAHCAGGHGYFVSNRMYGGWTAQPPVVAPGYSPAAGYVNDLAVLRLNRNVGIRPLPVASVEPPAGTSAISYGWGNSGFNTDDAGDVPRQLGMTILSAAQCVQYWSTVFVSSDMCASSAGTIASGDSGGPLVADGQIVGINDAAADVLGMPSIFTRTDLLAGWIGVQVKRLALDPRVAAGSGMAGPHPRSGMASGRG